MFRHRLSIGGNPINQSKPPLNILILCRAILPMVANQKGGRYNSKTSITPAKEDIIVKSQLHLPFLKTNKITKSESRITILCLLMTLFAVINSLALGLFFNVVGLIFLLPITTFLKSK